MGHKVHPTGFRVGIIYDWQSKWYAGKNYKEMLHEDIAIRSRIMKGMSDAGVSKVEIDRNANQLTVTIHTAKPGIVIGRNGANVDMLRNELEKTHGRRVRVNINEIRTPELDAYLVARNIADQLQRRVAFRRAIKQTVARTMARGAKGIKVVAGGRLGGAEMSRRETEKQGRIPLHTLRADIDFGIAEAHTTFGRIGVKVWIYKGDVMPEIKRPPMADRPEIVADAPHPADDVPAAVTAPAAEAAPAPMAVRPEIIADAPHPADDTPVAVASPAVEAAPAADAPVAETAEAAAPTAAPEAPATDENAKSE